MIRTIRRAGTPFTPWDVGPIPGDHLGEAGIPYNPYSGIVQQGPLATGNMSSSVLNIRGLLGYLPLSATLLGYRFKVVGAGSHPSVTRLQFGVGTITNWAGVRPALITASIATTPLPLTGGAGVLPQSLMLPAPVALPRGWYCFIFTSFTTTGVNPTSQPTMFSIDRQVDWQGTWSANLTDPASPGWQLDVKWPRTNHWRGDQDRVEPAPAYLLVAP